MINLGQWREIYIVEEEGKEKEKRRGEGPPVLMHRMEEQSVGHLSLGVDQPRATDWRLCVAMVCRQSGNILVCARIQPRDTASTVGGDLGVGSSVSHLFRLVKENGYQILRNALYSGASPVLSPVRAENLWCHRSASTKQDGWTQKRDIQAEALNLNLDSCGRMKL